MIADLIELLNPKENDVLGGYRLKDGLYIRVSEEGVEYFVYKDSKKEEKKELLLRDLEGNIRADEYEWFVARDYLSVYLSSNKAIDPPKKKIHSNNYLALFAKAKEFVPENRSHFLDKLFDNLKTFRDFTKKEERKVLEALKEYIYDPARQEDVERKKRRFAEIYDEVAQKARELGIKNYVKIFFDEPLKRYEEEARIYLALKIYNKIETVELIDGRVYGLSDFNMGLNVKKPYLEHKTRGFPLPFMVEKEEIYKVKRLFDFLKYAPSLLQDRPSLQDRKPGLVLHKHNENDKAVIDEYDIVVFGDEELPEPFVMHNFLLLKTKEKGYLGPTSVTTYNKLVGLIDEIFFGGQLLNNLYGDVYQKLPASLQNLIYLTRDLAKALQRGDIEALFGFLRFWEQFVLYHLRRDRLFDAAQAVNLALSIKAYKGEDVDIRKELERIEEKVEKMEPLESDEFFILAGQVIRYLLDRSKKSDKRADMIEPYLRAATSEKLKNEIELLYFRYKHEVPLYFTKLNHAIALLMAYDKKERVKKDKLLIGLLGENIFYKGSQK